MHIIRHTEPIIIHSNTQKKKRKRRSSVQQKWRHLALALPVVGSLSISSLLCHHQSCSRSSSTVCQRISSLQRRMERSTVGDLCARATSRRRRGATVCGHRQRCVTLGCHLTHYITVARPVPPLSITHGWPLLYLYSEHNPPYPFPTSHPPSSEDREH